MKTTGGDRLKAHLDRIAANLAKASSVDVGFQNGATEKNGKSVALIAALNEYGHGIGANPGEGNPDTRQQVPPRPFFRNAISNNKSKWPTNLATALKSNDYDAAKALGLVGQEIKEEIEISIESNTPPPNAPSTVARKGFDRTLIDTGVMKNSVTAVVK
jgi:hypothetical protein